MTLGWGDEGLVDGGEDVCPKWQGKKAERFQQTVYSPPSDATDLIPGLFSKHCLVKYAARDRDGCKIGLSLL